MLNSPISELIFSTPLPSPPSLQQEIIRETKTCGFTSAKKPFWLVKSVRNIVPTTLPERALKFFEARDYTTIRQIEFALRINSNHEWIWEDSPLATQVETITRPILPYFQKLTRAVVLLQIPGMAIPAHRDLVVGENYSDLENSESSALGPSALTYSGDPKIFDLLEKNVAQTHQAQNYLALKIPLSERGDDCGRPFYILNNQKYYYSTENRIFGINEYQLLHGAEAASFYRGVVFLDGVLNQSSLRALEKIPIVQI